MKHPIKNNDGLNPLLEIPEKDLVALLNSNRFDKTEISNLNRIINHPFINQKLNWVLITSIIQQSKVAEDFYHSVLTETFEQRNFIEHRGIFHDKSISKILTSLPRMVRDFRRIIVNEMAQNNYKNFSDLITFLLNKD